MEFTVDWNMIGLQIVSLGILLNFWYDLQAFANSFRIHPIVSNFIFAAIVIGATLLISYILIIALRRFGVVT